MSATVKKLTLSEVLCKIGDDYAHDRISVGDLLTTLGDRALGALLFIFSLPNILPTPPGTSVVLGVPLLFLAAQLTLGRGPWLPAFIARRSIHRKDFLALIRQIEPWLVKAEKLLRPRVSSLTTPPIKYVVGFVIFLLSIVLVLPIPFGNILPALAISLLSLGVLEKDGLWVLTGLLITLVSSFIVSGVVFAIIKTTFFLIQQIF